jgi:hypothetical protein
MKENNVTRAVVLLIFQLGANLRRILHFAISTIYSLNRTPECIEEEVGWGSDFFWNFSRNKFFLFLLGFEPLVVQLSVQLLY